MGTYKNFGSADQTSSPSSLNQLIDVIQEDVSGSLTRRKYQVFVTGGIGPGVTSSLFQTVYDQDFTLQTSNPIFDLTVGIFENFVTTTTVPGSSTAASGKKLFPSTSLMMREKIDNYKQMSSFLLGNASNAFYLGTSYPDNSGDSTSGTNRIDNAMFVNFKRLFARDRIRKETFAMRFYTSASISGRDHLTTLDKNGVLTPLYASLLTNRTGSNVIATSEEGVEIFADIGANTDSRTTTAGSVARIKKASNTTDDVGLLFYDYGIGVFDLNKICWSDQHMLGKIDAMNATTFTSGTDSYPAGTELIGARIGAGSARPNFAARFIPDFMVSASIDNIVDHLGHRFSSGTLTSMAFQNQTLIQSSVYFCRAAPGEFNYSTNPTYVAADGNLNVIEDVTDPTERSFSFITTVGLYNANNELMAVGKLSRPIEKNDEKDLNIRVRLDF